jgi:hypothetical protein
MVVRSLIFSRFRLSSRLGIASILSPGMILRVVQLVPSRTGRRATPLWPSDSQISYAQAAMSLTRPSMRSGEHEEVVNSAERPVSESGSLQIASQVRQGSTAPTRNRHRRSRECQFTCHLSLFTFRLESSPQTITSHLSINPRLLAAAN